MAEVTPQHIRGKRKFPYILKSFCFVLLPSCDRVQTYFSTFSSDSSPIQWHLMEWVGDRRLMKTGCSNMRLSFICMEEEWPIVCSLRDRQCGMCFAVQKRVAWYCSWLHLPIMLLAIQCPPALLHTQHFWCSRVGLQGTRVGIVGAKVAPYIQPAAL